MRAWFLFRAAVTTLGLLFFAFLIMQQAHNGVPLQVNHGRVVDGTGTSVAASSTPMASRPTSRVHAFYYAWWATPEVDGMYLHWNHAYIPHWRIDIARKYPSGAHAPPHDIGASFMPSAGCYSSANATLIQTHMQQMKEALIGIVIVSWYMPDRHDDNGKSPDPLMPMILNQAAEAGLFVAFHLEPYKGRTALSVRADIAYIMQQYGQHPALYRWKRSRTTEALPVFYVYDSYHISTKEWSSILLAEGAYTVRGKPEDGIYIGLVVERTHLNDLSSGGFDGIYTYFATNGFTYGSTWSSWRDIVDFCRRSNMLFIPSVGPGYDDVAVRPWNSENSRDRQNGEYYRKSWQAAIDAAPDAVSITSFNEWHEGTQIEPARPYAVPGGRKYLDYGPDDRLYLKLTSEMVRTMLDATAGVSER